MTVRDPPDSRNTPHDGGRRHHYLDWLRIGAFLLLILYHAGRAFFPEDPWHINDPVGNVALRDTMDLIARWRLPLLFFISGIGTWFIVSRRSLGKIVSNRLVRLGVPLVFGMIVVVAPQVWFERSFSGETPLGFFRWYFTEGLAGGPYPEGNISWHHLWYIAYLLVMTFLLLPLLVAYGKGRLPRLHALVQHVIGGPLLWFVFLFPLLIENTLNRIWPGKSNGLFGDWGWLAVTASWFLIGFLVAPHVDAFARAARRCVVGTAALWVGLSLVIVLLPGADDFLFHVGDLAIPYRNALTVPIAWFAILSLTALAAHFLDVDSAAKRYLNRAVYPLYIVHQTIALGIVYLVVPLDWSVSMKFGVTAVGTFALSLALYHFGIRRMGRAGVVFGLEGGREIKRGLAMAPSDP